MKGNAANDTSMAIEHPTKSTNHKTEATEMEDQDFIPSKYISDKNQNATIKS